MKAAYWRCKRGWGISGRAGRFGLLVMGLLAQPVWAAPNDPVLPELGRVFMTPEERVAIERAAAGQSGDGNGLPRVDGVMHRSAGASVVWQDGVPRYLETPPDRRASEVAQ